MNTQSNIDLRDRILCLERRLRFLQTACVLGVFTLIVAACASLSTRPTDDASAGTGEVLRVRGLVIVDENGTERVRLGAPLPDPIIQGKRVPRKGTVSGMLVYDAAGDERGGFATGDQSGEVFIGLDSKQGQVALFLANPHDGANLQLWDHNRNRIGMWAVGGAPHFVMVEEGETIFRLPRPTED